MISEIKKFQKSFCDINSNLLIAIWIDITQIFMIIDLVQLYTYKFELKIMNNFFVNFSIILSLIEWHSIFEWIMIEVYSKFEKLS